MSHELSVNEQIEQIERRLEMRRDRVSRHFDETADSVKTSVAKAVGWWPLVAVAGGLRGGIRRRAEPYRTGSAFDCAAQRPRDDHRHRGDGAAHRRLQRASDVRERDARVPGAPRARTIAMSAVSRFGSAFLTRWSDARCTSRAAALSFYAAFSLGPILIIVVAVGSLLADTSALTASILSEIEHLVGEQGRALAQAMLESAQSSPRGLYALVASGALLIGATTAFAELKDASTTSSRTTGRLTKPRCVPD